LVFLSDRERDRGARDVQQSLQTGACRRVGVFTFITFFFLLENSEESLVVLNPFFVLKNKKKLLLLLLLCCCKLHIQQGLFRFHKLAGN
jgi:hypothetical protein